jgi:tRNA pseudouridine(55) synthase
MKMSENNLQYKVLEKKVGETPLECVEAWRATEPTLANLPLAYAGRLDPMASGKLLILIGDTCKVQNEYHGLDKAYVFEILFGATSDSGDVLGLITETGEKLVSEELVTKAVASLPGEITLSYPIFSSRTVKGKPLHTWTLEGRLGEITIPEKTSTIYDLTMTHLTTMTRETVVNRARHAIELIKPVTDPRKAIGNDFRRPDVRQSWSIFAEKGSKTDEFSVATISCIASSGTYMRSLAEKIAALLGTNGLAFSIHRSDIGVYEKATRTWRKRF